MKTQIFCLLLAFAFFFSCQSQTKPIQKFHTNVGGIEYSLYVKDTFLFREWGDSVAVTIIKKTSIMEIFDGNEKSLGHLYRYEGEDGEVYFSPELGVMLIDGIFPLVGPNYADYFLAFSFYPKGGVLRLGEILCSDFGRNKTQMDWISSGGTEIRGFEEGFISGKSEFSDEVDVVFIPTKKPNIFLRFRDDLDELPEGLIEVDPKPLFIEKGHKYKKYKYLWSSF